MRISFWLRAGAGAVYLAAGGGSAQAGAWPLGEGETLAIAGGSFSDSLMAFDTKGKLIPVSSYRKFELSLYVEHGVNEQVTLVLRPSLVDVVSAGPPTGAYRGLEAVEAGARVLLGRMGDAVFSAQGSVRIPGSSDMINPALVGSTASEAEARLLAGYSFALFGHAAFAEAQAGWRVRTVGNPGEARADLTLGVRTLSWLQVLVQSFNSATTGAGTAAYPMQRISRLQPSLVADIGQGWSLQVGGFATVYAVNARRDRGAVAAVWKKF